MIASLDARTDVSEHMSEESMHEFAKEPSHRDFHHQRLHLASCPKCRSELSALQHMQTLIQGQVETIVTAGKPSALSAKLHASCHQLAMESALGAARTDAGQRDSAPASKAWYTSLFKIKIPALAAPAIAMAGFMFAFVFISSSSPSSTDVMSFQDSNILALQKPSAKPGLGFFHQDGLNEKLVENYSGFQVRSEGKFISIQWQAIAQVSQYQVELIEISDGVSQSIEKAKTENTQWRLERDRLLPGQLYRLTLTGKTSKNLRFRHTGGFILR
ncbi:MAG: hypothetical protein K6L76_09930 [Agarilytica sp.]